MKIPAPTPLVVSLLLLAAAPAAAQLPRVGVVDFYGLRRVSQDEARQALGIAAGDSLGDEKALDAARERLEALPGVTAVRLEPVCCEAGRLILYVGVVEQGAPMLRFNPEPTGAERLPADVVAAGEAFQEALVAAVMRGDVAEDVSQGHSRMHDSAARAVQERFIAFAARDLVLLREVLRSSASAPDRALAAQVIAYAADKRAVVPELVAAARDPSEEVRNNAIRALGVLAAYARSDAGAGIRIPWRPFVSLLESPVWSDRNKAATALLQLSETRDPELLNFLWNDAALALVEMARWTSPGHALPAFVLLGRIAGMTEEEIGAAWARGERGAPLAAAAERSPRLACADEIARADSLAALDVAREVEAALQAGDTRLLAVCGFACEAPGLQDLPPEVGREMRVRGIGGRDSWKIIAGTSDLVGCPGVELLNDVAHRYASRYNRLLVEGLAGRPRAVP